MKTIAPLLALFVTVFSYSISAQQLSIKSDSVAGLPSTQVIVPVRVFNFDNIIAMQGSVQFDTSVVSFDSIVQYGLPGMGTGNFSTIFSQQGRLAYSWDDATLAGVSVADSSVIFSIRFTLIGAAGASSPVCFGDNPTPREVADVNFNTVSVSYSYGNVAIGLCADATDCDDGDACTENDCNSLHECAYAPFDCNDVNVCTDDACDAGVCLNAPVVCDDFNLCTSDDCNGAGCVYAAIDCDDHDACTINDRCDSGSCISEAVNCDDADECTTDICDSQTGGCVNDGISCDDADVCTTDGCDTVSGCTFTAIVCDDGDVCTIDNCHPQTGCATVANDCNDSDACTADACDSASGCAHTPVVCDDGFTCTTDACVSGQCVFTHLLTAPEICIVGVDSATGKNIVVWEKPITSVIDSYVIYKETVQTDVYVVVGAQAYGDFSTFVDGQSAPEQNANKYKLGFVDVCGQTIEGTSYHKTIHLSVNQGVGDSWNLIWNHYEGFAFSTYNIYRGTTSANLALLDSVASNNDAYSDVNAPVSGTIYYQIEVINASTCNPSARMGGYSSSRSNIADASQVGVVETESGRLRMYPNPFESSITIEIPVAGDGAFEFTLYDVAGKKLLSAQHLTASAFVLHRGDLKGGVYYAELRGTRNVYKGKVIVL